MQAKVRVREPGRNSLMKPGSEKEEKRLVQLSRYERIYWEQGFETLAGVDEAGRGPLAGAVVAGAVILRPGKLIPGVRDSKKVTPRKREILFDLIQAEALAVGVGIVGPETIDKINILGATRLAMQKAIANLEPEPDGILVDGMRIPDVDIFQIGISQGDSLSISIGAASIIAKVTRDRMMLSEDERYPLYGFRQHKGYGTPFHLEALSRYGPCRIHRRSFRPVRSAWEKQMEKEL